MPSPVFAASFVISMPWTARPSLVRWLSVIGASSSGTATRATSCRSRSPTGGGTSRGRSGAATSWWPRRSARRRALFSAIRAEVGDADAVGEARVLELLGVVVAVEDDLDRRAVAVLGEVEAEALQCARRASRCARRRPASSRRCPRRLVGVDRQRRSRAVPRVAARLHGESAPESTTPSASSGRPARAAGDDAPGRVEDATSQSPSPLRRALTSPLDGAVMRSASVPAEPVTSLT